MEIPLKMNSNKKTITGLGSVLYEPTVLARPTGEARCTRFLLRNPFKMNLNKKTNSFVKSEIPYNCIKEMPLNMNSRVSDPFTNESEPKKY